MDKNLQLNEFFVEGNNQELSHVLLHIIQPSNQKEEDERGYFFAICEINNGTKEDIHSLQKLMDNIENDYYESPIDDGNLLENALEKANKEDFILNNPKAELSCIIGSLRNQEITFSFNGNPESLIFYKNKLGQYQKMDLIEANTQNENNEEKPFSQIIQGKINSGDYLFIGSTSVSSCFNHDRIQKVVSGGRTTEQTAKHFEKVLLNINDGYSYGGLIIHFPQLNFENKISETDNLKILNAKNTILDNEIKLEHSKSTKSTLDNIGEKVKSIIKQDPEDIDDQIDNTIPETTVKLNKNTNTTSKYEFKKQKQSTLDSKKLLNTIKIIWQGIKYIGFAIYYIFFLIAKIIVNIGRFVIMLFFVITNFQNRRHSILESWISSRIKIKKKINSLPTITKVLGIASIIFAIIFATSLVYIKSEKNNAIEKQLYQDNLQAIQNKIDAAESASIYGDEISSKQQIQEINTILNKFKCKQIDQNICNQIINRIDNLSLKLKKMELLDMATITDWGDDYGFNAEKFIKIDSNIIGFSNNTSTIIIYNLLSKKSTTLSPETKIFSGFTEAAVPKENDYAILLSADRENFAMFDPKNNEIKKIEVDFPNNSTNIAAISVYNRNLYTLDTKSNQIYKHSSIKNGFNTGRSWLKNTTINFSNKQSITIDGNIFTLGLDGKIYKFSKGINQNFDLNTVDPLLESADSIWTYSDLNNIYVLDSQNKRLILFNKDGSLIKQLTSKDMNNPISMIVEEEDNNIYILDNNKIYKIKL